VKEKKLSKLVAALAVVVLALMLAACGGGNGEQAPPTGGATTTPGAPAQFPPEFVECMEKHGIDTSSPEDFHAPGAQEAFRACQEFLHGG
jgi:ABC-type glycerol-3-phosphate transport system substrate-binding protein